MVSATIHLTKLLGKLYDYDRSVKAALQHDTDRRAARLAKLAGGLKPKQELLLDLVYWGSRNLDYLREADEKLFYKLQCYWGDAQDELQKEQARIQGRSELQLGVWKYAEQAVYKNTVARVDMFGEGWLTDYALAFALDDLSRFGQNDAILLELEELHRTGFTAKLLRDLWQSYAREATELRLPKPPVAEPADDATDTSSDAQTVDNARQTKILDERTPTKTSHSAQTGTEGEDRRPEPASSRGRGKLRTAGVRSERQLVLIGRAKVIEEALYDQVQNDTGKSLSQILAQAGVSHQTFGKSKHFQEARDRWKTLSSKRDDAKYHLKAERDR